MRKLTILTSGPQVTVNPGTSQVAMGIIMVIGAIVALATLPGVVTLVRSGGQPGAAFYFHCFAMCFAGFGVLSLAGKGILPTRFVFHNDRRQVEVVGGAGVAVLLPFERFTGFAVTSRSLGENKLNQRDREHQVVLQRADGGAWMLGGYTLEARAQADVLRLEQAVRLAPPEPDAGAPPPPDKPKRSPKLTVEDTPMATTIRWRPKIRWLNGIGGTTFLGSFAMLFIGGIARTAQWAAIIGALVFVAVWIYALSKHGRTLAVEVTRAHLRAFRPSRNKDLFRVELPSVATVVSIFGRSENSTELYVLTGPQMEALQSRQRDGTSIVNTSRSIRDGHGIDTFEMSVAQCVHLEQCLLEAIERWRTPQGYREAPAQARQS